MNDYTTNDPAVKLCECGCQQPLPIPKYPSTQRRFLKGHHLRGTLETGPNPSGMCLCGCGEPAPISKTTDRKVGWVIGKPKKYIFGHQARAKASITLEERFWDHVDKRGPDDCWLHRTKSGRVSKRYASINFGGKSLSAHRISWEIHNGPVPDGMLICHTCDVQACCNPAHLFIGSPLDNMQDKIAKGRENGFFESNDPRDRSQKLTEEKVREIRNLRKQGVLVATLASKYGVSVTTITRVINYKSWKHVA